MGHIDSFYPLLVSIPGLELRDGVYYRNLYRAVTREDVQRVGAVARNIGHFTLTDDIGSACGHPIHPGEIVHLQQAHSRFSAGPLLPSLRTLEIVNARASLDHLSILLTPSLTSLKVVNVDQTHQIAIWSFLGKLLQEGASLSEITLGPGAITSDLLRASLRFTNLTRLEVVGAFSFDFEDLKQVGCCPQLRDFTLDARNSVYTTGRYQAQGGWKWPDLDDSEPGNIPRMPDFERSGFKHLTALQVFGTLELMKDLCQSVISKKLQELKLTLVWRHPSTGVTENKDKLTAIQTTEAFVREVLQGALAKWYFTLTKLVICREGGRSSEHVIPCRTFAKFEDSRSLEELDIDGFCLTGQWNDVRIALPWKMKVLHLPIEMGSCQITLKELRSIALKFSRLTSFRCLISDISDVPIYPKRKAAPALDALSHCLQTLSVGNLTPSADPGRLLFVARYLNLLFPNLEDIATHKNYNEKQWKSIADLIDLCHDVRLDEMSRASRLDGRN
ncbi:hypothetical protein CVT26_006279 [Gymnopilus dilepis]|uniref:F-box domain-containing protein n=1 Tax=Gymnopilus dilepis TaxID=231916 RepID=A0A409VYN8_9AGAR|nr:hypothetical protein CVT26_006279 [Gymnopilus dilepis]